MPDDNVQEDQTTAIICIHCQSSISSSAIHRNFKDKAIKQVGVQCQIRYITLLLNSSSVIVEKCLLVSDGPLASRSFSA